MWFRSKSSFAENVVVSIESVQVSAALPYYSLAYALESLVLCETRQGIGGEHKTVWHSTQINVFTQSALSLSFI